jgi:hypothetical protein
LEYLLMKDAASLLAQALRKGVAPGAKQNPIVRVLKRLAHVEALDKRTINRSAKARMRKGKDRTMARKPRSKAREYAAEGDTVRKTRNHAAIPSDPPEEMEMEAVKGGPENKKSAISKARGYRRDGESAGAVRDRTQQELDMISRMMGSTGDRYEWEGDEKPTKNDIAYADENPTDGVLDEFVERFGEAALDYLSTGTRSDPPMPRPRPEWGDQQPYSGNRFNYPEYEQYGGKLPKGFDVLMKAFEEKMGRPPRDYAEFEKVFGDSVYKAGEQEAMKEE